MDLVVDDAMHPPDQSSRPGKENGNQFFRTGHWALGMFWEKSRAEWVKGERGPCFSHALMGNKLIHEVSDCLIPKYSQVFQPFTLLWADNHGFTS